MYKQNDGLEVLVCIVTAIFAVPLGIGMGLLYACAIIITCMKELGIVFVRWLIGARNDALC